MYINLVCRCKCLKMTSCPLFEFSRNSKKEYRKVFDVFRFGAMKPGPFIKPNFSKSGQDSRFVLQGIIKALISKSSRSLIWKTPNSLQPIHDFQPNSSLPEYLNFHTCLHDSDYGCVNLNTQILEYLTTIRLGI